jgi:hypothetical protein
MSSIRADANTIHSAIPAGLYWLARSPFHTRVVAGPGRSVAADLMTGEPVAAKVQRPDIHEALRADDIDPMYRVAAYCACPIDACEIGYRRLARAILRPEEPTARTICSDTLATARAM